MKNRRKTQPNTKEAHDIKRALLLDKAARFIEETRYFILLDCFRREQIWQAKELLNEVNYQLKHIVGVDEEVDLESLEVDLCLFEAFAQARLYVSQPHGLPHYTCLGSFETEYGDEALGQLKHILTLLCEEGYFANDKEIGELVRRLTFLIRQHTIRNSVIIHRPSPPSISGPAWMHN